MKNLNCFLIFCFAFVFISCQNTKKDKWVSLFNGKDLSHWTVKIRGFKSGVNAYNTFRVENGILKNSYSEYDSFKNQFGHIFYKKPFKSYILRLEYRFVGHQAKGGESWGDRNNGIMIFSQSPESMAIDQGFPVSVEFQLLGGLVDGKPRPTGNVCTPGTDIVMKDSLVTTHCIDSSSKTYFGNQWVKAEVEVHSDSLIIQRINGQEVMRYSKPQIGGRFNTFANRVGEHLKGGYIALQSESSPTEFRNIEILVLDN